MVMCGDPNANNGLGQYCAQPGVGIWKGSVDFETATMDIDMATNFVTEKEMYDDPTYPATAPRPDPVTGRI